MNKTLESLERIETVFSLNKRGKPNVYRGYLNSIYPFYEDYVLVEKVVIAFDIIIKKEVKINKLKTCNRETYNNGLPKNKQLTDDEYKLLKEVSKYE